MSDRVVLRNSGDRILEVSRLVDGSLRIRGHDFGPEVERIFGSPDYEWYKTVPLANIARFRRVLGVPDDSDLLAHLEEHYSSDQGHSFETLVREHDLAEDFWSSP
jgi:hypothetical protein